MLLLIGYGNTLRSDDGVGAHVAREIAALGWPTVTCTVVHQLTPELAAQIATADKVLFVDAQISTHASGVTSTPIVPEPAAAGPMTHTATPQALMGLAQALYGRCPPALLISIPGERFELGDSLSASALRGAEAAIKMIGALLAAQMQEARHA